MTKAKIPHESLFNKIEDLLIKTILSIEHLVFQAHSQHVPYRTNCFDLLGFDVLIDQSLKPWLLEVNLSPSLSCGEKLDLKVKGNLIADLFTLIGIVPLG